MESLFDHFDDRGRGLDLNFYIHMIHVTFQFADGVRESDFVSTFDAYCEILDANNYCEEYFLGATIDNNVVKILDAERYISEIYPAKGYLENAVLYGFPESQIQEETTERFGRLTKELPESWKQHMMEFAKCTVEYTDKCADQVREALK